MAQLNPQKLPAYNALISGTGFVSADVIPLTNYDGLAVCILDGNGNQITTFGGGSVTQYTYGTVNTTPIGTVAFGQTPSNVLQSLSLDSSGNLKVNIASGSSSGVQYADDVASGATPTGTLGMGWDSINAVVRALKVDTTQNLYVNVSNFPSTQNVNIQNSSIAVTGTFWQATQPVSISGTVATSSAQLPAALDGSGNLKVAVENSPSVSVSNFPSTQPISGTIAVSNFPSTQAVTGTFWQTIQPVSQSGAWTVATNADSPRAGGIAPSTALVIGGTYNNPRLGLTAGQSAGLSIDSDGTLLVQVVDWTAGTLTISGTVTANQGTANTAANAWPSYITVSGSAIDPRQIRALTSSDQITISNSSIAVTGTFWQTTQPVSGSVSVSNFPATQAVSWSGQSVAVTGTVTVSGTVASTQSGTWTNTVTQATGTNLHAVIDSGSVTITGTPAISGTVTANQGTANTAANAWPTATIVSGAAIDPRQIRALTSADVVSLPTAQVTTLTPPTAAAIGTAVAAPTAAAIASAIVANPPTTPLPTGQVTTLTPPTAAAIGSAVASALTNPLPVSIAATVNTSDAHAYAIGSTTSGQSGFLEFGAVTSTNPVYTTATSEPLSLSQIGALRADATAWGGTAVSAPTVFGVSPISSSGTTSTYATTGASSPSALAFDSSGNAWVGGNNGVVQLSPTGTILQTLTPTGNIRGVAVDSSNNVWVGDNTANSIIEYSSAGALLNTYTTGIHGPRIIAFDSLGNLWVPNNGSNTLVKLSSGGTVLATATVGNGPFAVAIDASNNAWVSVQNTSSVVKVSNSGTILGTFALATGADPYCIAIDANQNIWTANFGNGTVNVLSNAGVILQTITLPTGAKPISIAIDSLGNAWVSGGTGGDNNIHVISPGGAVIASYPTGASPYDVGIDSSGNVWVTNETANSVTKLSGYSTSTGIATNASLFSGITPLTNTAGALNVNVSSGSISVSGTATTTPAAATIQGVSAVTGSASVKTAPIFTAVADGTNVSVLTATGTAPATSTFSLPVASVMYAGATPTALGTPNTFGTTAITGNALGVNASLFMGTTLARTNQTTTATGVVDVNIVGSLGVTNSATNGSFFRLTDNTTALTAAVSSLGTAPTGTGVMAVNSVLLPSAASGASCTLFSNSTVTTAVVAKASAGNLYGCLVNGGTSGNFLQFINASSAPALGTAPVFSIQIPASGIISIPPGVFALDNFTSGISVGISTTYNGASAGTAASVVLFYK